MAGRTLGPRLALTAPPLNNKINVTYIELSQAASEESRPYLGPLHTQPTPPLAMFAPGGGRRRQVSFNTVQKRPGSTSPCIQTQS